MFRCQRRVNDIQRIALAHVPHAARDAVSALWALDAALGQVVATTTEPLIGQMRLTWWHERLTSLGAEDVPAEPILQSLHDVARYHDVTGAMLAELVEGWELLLDDLPIEFDVLAAYATKRGDKLFALSAQMIGAAAAPGSGAGWALIDFAMHCSDTVTAERAWMLAGTIFANCDSPRPRSLRILGHIARSKSNQPFANLAKPISRWILLSAVLW